MPFYRSRNVVPILRNDENLTFITKRKNAEEAKTSLTVGDLMIVKTGKSGASVLFSKTCNVSQDVIAVKARRDKVNPYYLAVFLNTKHGKSEMDRWFQGQVQPHLSLEDVRKIWVSIIPDDEQKAVEGLVVSSSEASDNAEKAYTETQQFTDSELGLDKLHFDKPVGYSARFSELESSHRSDAQHSQLRFTQLLNHLAKFLATQIRDVRRHNQRGIQPIYVC